MTRLSPALGQANPGRSEVRNQCQARPSRSAVAGQAAASLALAACNHSGSAASCQAGAAKRRRSAAADSATPHPRRHPRPLQLRSGRAANISWRHRAGRDAMMHPSGTFTPSDYRASRRWCWYSTLPTTLAVPRRPVPSMTRTRTSARRALLSSMELRLESHKDSRGESH